MAWRSRGRGVGAFKISSDQAAAADLVDHVRAQAHTDPQVARLDAGLAAGDPDWEVTVAWQCYQQLRSIYHAATPVEGRPPNK